MLFATTTRGARSAGMACARCQLRSMPVSASARPSLRPHNQLPLGASARPHEGACVSNPSALGDAAAAQQLLNHPVVEGLDRQETIPGGSVPIAAAMWFAATTMGTVSPTPSTVASGHTNRCGLAIAARAKKALGGRVRRKPHVRPLSRSLARAANTCMPGSFRVAAACACRSMRAASLPCGAITRRRGAMHMGVGRAA
jgi:hypothetical protein